MTALRQRAIMELEKIPEDMLLFVKDNEKNMLDYVRVNGLYNDSRAKPRLPRNIRN